MVRRSGQKLVVAIAAAIVAGVPASASAASWRALMVGDSTASNALIPIDVGNDTAGAAIGAGNNPFGVAVSPAGLSAYVADYNVNAGGANGITAIDLSQSPPTSSFIATDPSGGTFKPLNVALSPDGRTLWAVYPPTGRLEKIDLAGASPTVGAPFSDGTNDGADSIALSPDGRTAWVTDQPEGQLTPIDLTQNPPAPRTPIPIGSGSFGTCDGASGSSSWPFGIGVSPDGSKVFVADIGTDQLSVIDTATKHVTNVDLPAGGGAYDVAVAPDGQTVYVSQPCAHDVVPVSVSGTPRAGTPITVTFPDDSSGSPQGLAITPDGLHLFVGDGANGGNQTVDVPLPSGTPQTAVTGGNVIRSGVVTPDQAPVANFNATSAPPGQPVSFDASSSTVASGSIVRYDWDFGDGSHATTSAPTVAHAYAAAGTYTASVTETDSAGTSTAVVYTGRSVARDGGPSAVVSRSVIVDSGLQPGVALSTTSLDFGTQTGPVTKTVTLTNSGRAQLAISGSSIGGAAASDFALSRDACTGQTVAVGASCSVDVTFEPKQAGSRTAALAFLDNASGSPHTVQLTGVGADQGTIHGVVSDASRPGSPPLGGVRVELCPNNQWNLCQSLFTAADGSYSFTGAPATYRIVVYAPGGLAWQSAYAPLAALETLDESFALLAPQPTSPGLTVNGQSGVLGWSPWGQPDSSQTTVKAPGGQAAGTLGATLVSFFTEPFGGDALQALKQAANGYLLVYYRYDGAGVPRFLADVPYRMGNPPPAPAYSVGRWTLSLDQAPIVGQTDVRALSVDGVLSPAAKPYDGAESEVVTQLPLLTGQPGAPAPGAGAGTDTLASVLGSMGTLSESLPSGVTRIAQLLGVLSGGAAADSHFATARAASGGGGLGSACMQPVAGPNGDWSLPNGWSFSPNRSGQPGNGAGFYSMNGPNGGLGDQVFTPDSNGDYVYTNGNPNDPGTDLTPGATIGSPGGNGVTFTVNPDGSLTMSDPTGSYHMPKSGDRIDYTPPPSPANPNPKPTSYPPGAGGNGPNCNSPQSANPYKDPSGTVSTVTHIPLAGARVILEAAHGRRGPFRAVPNGSTVMSPSNRRNPFLTGPGGLFGWDVLAGFYRIVATHPGCTAPHGGRIARTRALKVPPPVTGLGLVLSCPHLHRASSTIRLRLERLPAGQLLILVQVRARVPRRYGLVHILAGRLRRTAPIDPRNGRAAFTISAAGLRRVSVRYDGDGYAAPSRAVATAPGRGKHRR